MSEMRSTLNLLSESKYHEVHVVIRGIHLEEHYIDRQENPTAFIIQLG